jgi:hypothetical protein
MKPERVHLLIGLVWLLLGMLLGEHMGRTGDHGQMPTHAHMMLAAGVLPVLWALIYRLFAIPQKLLAWVQTGLQHVGALIMVVGLFLLYGGRGDEAVLGPVLGISGLMLMVSVLLMLWLAFRAKP